MPKDADTGTSFAEALIEREEGQFRLRHSDPGDHIWKVVHETGDFYESDFLDALARDLKSRDLVIDVGANIGNHAIYFAGVCEARVVAFEPNPDALVLLRENIAANGLRRRIDVRGHALGAAKGLADLDISAASGNLGAVKLRLAAGGVAEVKRLDDVPLPGPPKLIKIDVEGMDLDVLRGAEVLLAEHLPIVAIEAASRTYYEDVSAFLEELGYVRRQSMNYTPTHIFVPAAKGKTSQFNRQVARELGGVYIDMAAARAHADQKIAGAQSRMTSLESSVGTASRQLAATLAADVQRVEAGLLALSGVLEQSSSADGERIKTLDGSLTEVKTTVAGIVAKLDAQFAEAQLGLSQYKSALEQIVSQVGDANRSTAVELSTLRGTVTGLGQDIGERVQKVADEYQAGRTSIETISGCVRELQAALARLTDNIGFVAKSVDVQFYDTGVVLKEHTQVSALIRDKVSELGDGLARLSVSLSEIGPQVDRRFNETLDELRLAAEANRLISSRVHGLESGLLDIASGVSDANSRLEQTRSEITAGLNRTSAQNEILAGAIDGLETMLSRQLSAIDARSSVTHDDLHRFGTDAASRLTDLAARAATDRAVIDRLEAGARELQSQLATIDGRLAAGLERTREGHQEAIAHIAQSQTLFEAGLGELRRLVSQGVATTEQTGVRIEQAARDQFGDLAQQLAEATRRIELRVDAAISMFATDRADLQQRLDHVDGRVETRFAALKSIAEGRATELRGAISAVSQNLTLQLRDRFGSVETSLARQAAETAARLSAMEGAQSEHHVRAVQMEGDILAGLEISSHMGMWIDRKVEGVRAEIADHIGQSIERVRQTLSAELRASTAAQVEMVGKAVADIVLELQRRQDEVSPPPAPPHRAFDLDTPRRAVDVPILARTPALLQPPPAPDRVSEAVSASELAPPARSRRAAAPVWSQRAGVETDRIPGEHLASTDFTRSWNQLGWPQSGTTLLDGGRVRFSGGNHWPGVVTAKYPAKAGGVIRITIDLADQAAGHDLVARVRNDRDELCGPDIPLEKGLNTFRVFATERTEAVKVYVLALPPVSEGEFKLRAITIDRLSVDAHQRAVRQAIGAPVLASMASIPSRRRMLWDCVNSLLAQCDRVRVFLNNYPDVPDFLNHPRIEVRRSQDWDDRGDAGKVFWIDRDREEGYRLLTDDDLLFPPDFAEVMCGKVQSYDNRAILGLHAILLRQPLRRYYDPDSRAATLHFTRRLAEDTAVHIGGTATMCFHSSTLRMKWSDFSYCNSADVWISLYAQRHNVPIISASRPQGWVRENTHEAPEETIYHHSRGQTRTRMDSSLVQDAALRHAMPLTLQPTHKPKLGLAVVVEDVDQLSDFIAGWAAARTWQADWVVCLVPAEAPEIFRHAISGLVIEHETHLFDTNAPLTDRIQAARSQLVDLGVEAALFVTEKVRFARAGWEGAVFSPSAVAERLLIVREAGDGQAQVAPWTTKDCRQAIAIVERSFRDLDVPGDRKGVAPLILDGEGTLALPALRGAFKAVSVSSPAVFRNGRKPRGGSINEVFERVVVLNLDRRPDRWSQAQLQLQQAGIRAERFSAVDGSVPEVDAEYQRYAALPLAAAPVGQRELKYSEDFYIHAESQAARIAHIEQRSGRKAIASRGAWGYLKSYRAVLEQALKDQVESLLVFDDDVLLHSRTSELFGAVSRQLPEDWLLLQLGTLQYNWKSPWYEPVSENLYRTRGSAIGSHAVGIRFDMMPYLLDHASRMDMPFDVGALSAATQAFSDRSFITLPNIAIQRLGAGSDINTSDFQKQTDVSEIAKTYRWNLADYFPDIV